MTRPRTLEGELARVGVIDVSKQVQPHASRGFDESEIAWAIDAVWTLIAAKRGGLSPERLTHLERMFCDELGRRRANANLLQGQPSALAPKIRELVAELKREGISSRKMVSEITRRLELVGFACSERHVRNIVREKAESPTGSSTT